MNVTATRRRKPMVGIAHQTIMAGDAIGNDITGQYRILERCGYHVSIICEYAHPLLHERYRVVAGEDLQSASSGLALLLYHHSIHWGRGEEMLKRFDGPLVVKYHNVTPPDFFAPYSRLYEEVCREGRLQTGRLVHLPNIRRWQADSSFNAGDLHAAGVAASGVDVVPPFNRIDAVFTQRQEARYDLAGPFRALFVGRCAPNKGHVHILHTLAAWRDLFPETQLQVRIVGAMDAELGGYNRELSALQRELRLDSAVQWLGQVSDTQLDEAFRSSHLYLNLSEHEGFCVPVVESQALGLPVVSTNAAALRDTAGADQLTVDVPSTPEDYDLIAGLAHRICVSNEDRRPLVEAGARNAYSRFTSSVIGNRFMEHMEPVLSELEA